MKELNILADYLIENRYVSTYDDAVEMIPSMREEWIISILDEYLEENYLFNYIMEMRKEDKVKGKGKTPLWVSQRGGKAVRAPEGSKNKWEIHRHTGKVINPEAMIGRMKQGKSASQSYDTTGSTSGYGPHLHGKGGRLRGVKKERGSKKAPDWGTPEHKMNQSKAYKTYNDRKAAKEQHKRALDRISTYGYSKYY